VGASAVGGEADAVIAALDVVADDLAGTRAAPCGAGSGRSARRRSRLAREKITTGSLQITRASGFSPSSTEVAAVYH
jgi:hypothetical protein